MRYDSFDHHLNCCFNGDYDFSDYIVQAVEHAPVPVAEEVPPMQRKVNWRT